jgi:hydrogenase expression/formation protein HypC
MQVTATSPGYAQCAGRGDVRRVRTALVGDVAIGQWVLIFIDSAQECITPERAQEINATLDLMQAAMNREPGDILGMTVGFALPSAMSIGQLLALSGAPDKATAAPALDTAEPTLEISP